MGWCAIGWMEGIGKGVEPKGSLPCFQEPAPGPYPEPDQSIPLHPTLLFNIRFSTVLSSMTNCKFFQVESSLYVFRRSPNELYAPPISSSLI
jgi:hypothetical protein